MIIGSTDGAPEIGQITHRNIKTNRNISFCFERINGKFDVNVDIGSFSDIEFA